MRCSKQPPYSITLSAWPSNEGGLDSALAFRRQLDGQICRLFPHSNLLHVSDRPLSSQGRVIGLLPVRRSGAMTRQCGDRQLCCKLLPVQRCTNITSMLPAIKSVRAGVGHALCLAK